jgi:hypothetical protein
VLYLPFGAYYSYGILAEPPAYFGITLFAYGWARSGDGASPLASRRWSARLGGAGAFLFVFCRPNGILLVPLAAAAAFVLGRRRGPDEVRQAHFALRCALAGLAALLLTAATGHLSPGGGAEARQGAALLHVLFHGRFQFREEPFDWRFWDAKTRGGSKDFLDWTRLHEKLEAQEDAADLPRGTLKLKWVLADVVSRPSLTIRQALERTVYSQLTFVNSTTPTSFAVGPLRGPTGYLVIHSVINTANALLLIASLRMLYARRRSLLSLWPLWGPILALLSFHCLTYMEPRYMFPVRPLTTAMASVVLADLLRAALHRGRGGALPASSAGARPR